MMLKHLSEWAPMVALLLTIAGLQMTLNHNLRADLRADIGRLDAGQRALAEQVAGVRERLAALEIRVGQIETRVGQIETRVGRIETRVGQIETRVGQIETRVGQIEARLMKKQS